MFDISRPPLLVQPILTQSATIFNNEPDYAVHPLTKDLSVVGFKEGWIFPMPPRLRGIEEGSPMLMVKNSGQVTSQTSTTIKGYAHVFCDENGEAPKALYEKRVFEPESSVEWLFVENGITMIWFQYGEKLQFIGDDGNDSERFYYGKLLIRRFNILESIAPGFDKKADVLASCTKLLTVNSTQIYSGGWNINDDSPKKCINEIISANKLDKYSAVVQKALSIASGA